MKLTYEKINNYVVVDLETTGLSANWDEIIEMAILKIENGVIVDSYSTLIKPNNEINEYVTELTGITNEMVKDAPLIKDVLPQFIKSLENQVIIGHNVNFDINFLKRYCFFSDIKLHIDQYCDTLFLSRRLIKHLDHYRLKDLVEYFNIEKGIEHRSLNDCLNTYKVYEQLKLLIPSDGIHTNKNKKSHSLKELKSVEGYIDEDCIFYNMNCVFTGALDKMVRKEAAQIVLNIGGHVEDVVTKKTNFLILGNNDYCTTLKGGKSSKQKKAESLKLKGQDIQIITENEFLSALGIDND